MRLRRFVLMVVLGLALAGAPRDASADPGETVTCPATVGGWSLMPLDVAGLNSYENRTADWVGVHCPYTSDLAYYTSGQYQRDLDTYGNGEYSKPLPPGGQLGAMWALNDDFVASYCDPSNRSRFEDIAVYSPTRAGQVTWSADINVAAMQPVMLAAAERLLTDVEPLARACRTETAGAGSAPPASSSSLGSDVAVEPVSHDGGIPTEGEILIAVGLIMSLLGGVTTFQNLPSRIKRITPGLADGLEVADRIFVPDAGPELIQDIFDVWTTSDPPAPPNLPLPRPPVVDEPPPLRPSQVPVRPNDLNDPRNTNPTVGHQQFVQWVQQVEAANPGADWRQVIAGLHGEVYADDLDRTIPGTPILLFMPGAETAGWQDVRGTVSWAYNDRSGPPPVARNAPKFVVNPDGTRLDVGHAYAGVRSDLNRHPGETVENLFRSINTDAGDTWQEWMGAPSESWAQGRPALAHQYAPPDQRLGNTAGNWLSDFYRQPEHANVKLSEAFQKWFETRIPPSP